MTAQPARSREVNPISRGRVTQLWLASCSTGSCTSALHLLLPLLLLVAAVARASPSPLSPPLLLTCQHSRSAHDVDVAGTHANGANALIRGHCSYETCGNLDSYAAEKHYRSLRGRNIRVSYPGDSSTGYTLVTEEDGSRGGSMVQFMRDIAADAGFTWEIHEVSPASRARYSSSYSACTHEVALNRTDVRAYFNCCRACFDTTLPNRLRLSPLAALHRQLLDVRMHWKRCTRCQYCTGLPLRSDLSLSYPR